MQTQSHVRFKKRVPCEFRDDSGNHIGMALNVSERGLFVSSRTTPQVGSRVVLDLTSQSGPSAIGIAARVVWKRKVHPRSTQWGTVGSGSRSKVESRPILDFSARWFLKSARRLPLWSKNPSCLSFACGLH